MGKVAKVALPIAALGAGAYFLGPSLFGSFAAGSAKAAALGIGQAAAPALSGGFSLFSAKGAGLAMGGMSMLTSYQNMQMQKYGFKMDEMRMAEEQRLRDMQAGIDEANAMREAYRARQSSMAKAAAMGQDISASRSFMAYLEEEDKALQREIDSIRVNAGSRRRITGMQIASAKASGRSAGVTGGLDIGRKLFATVKDYKSA